MLFCCFVWGLTLATSERQEDPRVDKFLLLFLYAAGAVGDPSIWLVHCRFFGRVRTRSHLPPRGIIMSSHSLKTHAYISMSVPLRHGSRMTPTGKLRLLYEGAPMAFICEQVCSLPCWRLSFTIVSTSLMAARTQQCLSHCFCFSSISRLYVVSLSYPSISLGLLSTYMYRRTHVG